MSTQISLLSWSHHFWSLEIMENLWTLDAAGVGMGSRARGENTHRLAWGRSWKGVGCHASFLPCESLPPGPLPLTEQGAGATQGGRVDRQSPGLTPEPTGKTLQGTVSSLISQTAGLGQRTHCTRQEATPTLGGLDQNARSWLGSLHKGSSERPRAESARLLNGVIPVLTATVLAIPVNTTPRRRFRKKYISRQVDCESISRRVCFSIHSFS